MVTPKVDVYAHWLDGELFHQRAACIGPIETRKRRVEGVLKLQCLFGNRISLGDVQLTDSRMMLELFQDKDFCTFIRKEPSAIRLVAAPHSKVSADSEQLACVLSGLAASLKKGWRTSSFTSEEIPQEVVKRLLKERSLDAARALVAKGGELRATPVKDPDDKRLYAGLMNGLEHFLGYGQFKPHVPRKRATYYETLQKAHSKPKADNGDRMHEDLGAILHSIEKNVPEKVRGCRSNFINTLKLPRDVKHYTYVLQAWNLAVARSVKPTQQSAYGLPQAEPLPLVFGSLAGTTAEAPVTVDVADKELFEYAEHLSWNPAQMSWSDVYKVRSACESSIDAYQDSIGNETEFRELIKAMARVEVGTKSARVPKWFEFICHGANAAEALMLIFGIEAPEHLGSSALLAEFALQLRKLRDWRNTTVVAQAIRSHAIRYNIHHPKEDD